MPDCDQRSSWGPCFVFLVLIFDIAFTDASVNVDCELSTGFVGRANAPDEVEHGGRR